MQSHLGNQCWVLLSAMKMCSQIFSIGIHTSPHSHTFFFARLELLAAGDFNSDLAVPEGNACYEDIDAPLATTGV